MNVQFLKNVHQNSGQNSHPCNSVNEKADKSHDCDEETKGGEEIQASDLADTCEEQGGHNHPGVGDTLQVTLCSTMQHTAALHLT